MAKVKHTLTIEIELKDLSTEERIELHEGSGLQGDPDDPEDGLPTVHDVSTLDLFDAIAYAIEASDDMWAGSNCYCKCVSISSTINGTKNIHTLERDDWSMD